MESHIVKVIKQTVITIFMINSKENHLRLNLVNIVYLTTLDFMDMLILMALFTQLQWKICG